MRKSIKISSITVTIIMLLVITGGSICMIECSLRRSYPVNVSYKDRFAHIINDNPKIRPWIDSLIQGNFIHGTLVTMQDDEQYHAVFVYAPQPTRKTVAVLHGYHDSHTGMMQIAHIYAYMGYNVPPPGHHAHG